MADVVIEVPAAHLNISPDGFRLAARDYFKCYLDFEKPDRVSVVPFFLLCRAIELALKALHLETLKQIDVKNLYGHDLAKAYRGLAAEQRTLTTEEVDLLNRANEIYRKKDFEYFNVLDAATGHVRYPDLEQLAALARKLTNFE